MHDKAAAQARVAQDRQASYYDAGRREPSFKPGDRVWKRSHPLSSAATGIAAKLATKFEGPYWITDTLSPNTYRLIGEGGQVEEVVAADQLKPCHSEQPEEIEAGASNAPVYILYTTYSINLTSKEYLKVSKCINYLIEFISFLV